MRFIVDTGATMVTLNTDMAKNLGMDPSIEVESISVSTASAGVEVSHE